MTQSDKNKKVVVTQEFVDKLIDKISKILKAQYTLFEHDNEKQELIELLSKKVSLIEGNFEELTKSLAKGSYPVKLARSIKVTESLITPQIQAIEISKSQLIQTYNEIVALLSGYAIPVTLTPESYRNLDRDSIFLETTIKGNYWVITTIEDKQHQYWLVPNSNLKFNIHQLKTIEILFTFKGNYNSQTTEFILQEPASLSLLPNNKHWKLLQPGILFFGENKTTQPEISQTNTTPNNTQQAEINRQISSNIITLTTTVKELNDKVLALEIDATVAQKEHQREQQKWQTEKQALNKKLQEFITSQSQLNNSIKSGDRNESCFLNNNISTELNEKDLATIKDLRSYFEKMPEIIRSYHSDHNASKQEAEILINYCDRSTEIIKTVKNYGDLIKLYDYLIAFKGKLSKYNHRERKYRWSVILENEVLTKLQKIIKVIA